MDIRNSTEPGFIDNNAIVQLGNLYSSINNSLVDLGYLIGESRVEYPEEGLTEDNYCPLPEYCLIEDKWKYVTGIL